MGPGGLVGIGGAWWLVRAGPRVLVRVGGQLLVGGVPPILPGRGPRGRRRRVLPRRQRRRMRRGRAPGAVLRIKLLLQLPRHVLVPLLLYRRAWGEAGDRQTEASTGVIGRTPTGWGLTDAGRLVSSRCFFTGRPNGLCCGRRRT